MWRNDPPQRIKVGSLVRYRSYTAQDLETEVATVVAIEDSGNLRNYWADVLYASRPHKGPIRCKMSNLRLLSE